MRQPPVRRMDDTVFAFEMGRVGMESMEKYRWRLRWFCTVSIKFNKIHTEEAFEIIGKWWWKNSAVRSDDSILGSKYGHAKEIRQGFFFIFCFLEKFMTHMLLNNGRSISYLLIDHQKPLKNSSYEKKK